MRLLVVTLFFVLLPIPAVADTCVDDLITGTQTNICVEGGPTIDQDLPNTIVDMVAPRTFGVEPTLPQLPVELPVQPPLPIPPVELPPVEMPPVTVPKPTAKPTSKPAKPVERRSEPQKGPQEVRTQPKAVQGPVADEKPSEREIVILLPPVSPLEQQIRLSVLIGYLMLFAVGAVSTWFLLFYHRK